MISCPNCQAENRLGARFCKNCAAPLPDSPAATRPLYVASAADDAPTEPHLVASNKTVTRKLGQTGRTDTKPLGARQPFLQRPAGAIFGDQYVYQSLLSSDASLHRYWVDQLGAGEELQIRVCPNPECGAIFPPRSEAPEMFCTDCGTVLEKGGDYLVLTESGVPLPENIVRIASKGLSHGSVRAPLAAFVERLEGEPRYCLVAPFVQMIEDEQNARSMNAGTILKMGFTLGRGLDYLHDNGVHFGGKAEPACVGLVGDRAVWADFGCCVHHPDGFVADRLPDTLALAKLVYFWLTGKDHYEPGSDLSPSLQKVFDQVFVTTDVVDGQGFARLMESAMEEDESSLPIHLLSGRRSDVGMARSLNEDSLMCMELERTKQSTSRMIGVYLVADGMGGHTGGEVASGQIVETFTQMVFERLMPSVTQDPEPQVGEWLKSAVETSNQQIFDLRTSAGTDMGSTLVAATMVGNRAYITHIGDSRAYLLNQKEIRQLTVDHSLVERMVASNQITREEARHHPQRNVIYRTVGDKLNIEVDVARHTLAVGDHLLLCSDGLSGMVEDDVIHKIVLAAGTPQEACDQLIRAANAAGGDDNISVIIVKVDAAGDSHGNM